jgi:hypothetical protein
MITGTDALGRAENECGEQSKKTGRDATVSPKTSLRAQNVKMEPDALGTVENEFGRTKHENGT